MNEFTCTQLKLNKNFIFSGFDSTDGIPLLRLPLVSLVDLVETGVFELLGWAAVNLAAKLENIKVDTNKEIPADVQLQLEKYELPITHIKGTVFATQIRYKKKNNGIPGG